MKTMSHDLLVQMPIQGSTLTKPVPAPEKGENRKSQALKIIVECEAVVSKHSSAISRVDG